MMLAVDIGAGVNWSNTINLGAAIIIALGGIATLGGIWYAVRGKGEIGRWKDAAERWKTERDAAVSNAERLTTELTDLKVKFAQAETAHVQEMAAHTAEQTEIRHDLKNQVKLLELKTDQTPVFEGLKQILERMNAAESSGVATVAQLLEGMEERAVNRDAALLVTQQKIAASLDQLAERIAALVARKVGDVVQEKVDQLQSDLPSPDRQE